jgi:uncharacterized protein
MGMIADFRANASTLMERWQFLRQAGITFKGKRDTYEIFGYQRNITNKDYRDRYARGDIAARIIECYPKATWREGAKLQEDEDPKTTTVFEQTWMDFNTRLQIWPTFERTNILARLSQYAVLLIGTKDGQLGQPLPRGSSTDDIIFLTPFAGGGGAGTRGSNANNSSAYMDATIASWVTDPRDPRFGLPETYNLRRMDATSPLLEAPVHWSRLIHVAEGLLDDEVYGQPCLENIWNRLDDWDKVMGGGAEAFFQRANAGINLNLDKDVAMQTQPNKEADKQLQDEFEDYTNNISRLLKTRGMDVKQLGSDVADFSKSADAIITAIAGAKGIPKRILTGSEMGQLASGQDRDNWDTQIQDYRNSFAGPRIVRAFVDRLIEFGYLPKPTQYVVVWPTVSNLTEDEKASGASKWAQVNRTAGLTVFSADEIRYKWYSLDPLEESDDESFKADLAVKMATANKTQGLTLLTPDEIRKTAYGWAPLSPDEMTPVGAPERISVNAPPPEPGDENQPLPAPMPVAAQASLLRALEAAIKQRDTETIDAILGVGRRTMKPNEAAAEKPDEGRPHPTPPPGRPDRPDVNPPGPGRPGDRPHPEHPIVTPPSPNPAPKPTPPERR